MVHESLRVPSSSQRPGSSLSTRSVSRASQRPLSRLSHLSITKQPRLSALLRTLVEQVTDKDEERSAGEIQNAMDLTVKIIDQMKQASLPSMDQIDAQFSGHIEKARINLHDTLADMLRQRYIQLKSNVRTRKDLDLDIKQSTLPNHLRFLLFLSAAPAVITHSRAEDIASGRLDREPPEKTLSWEDILQDEPFEGQHWQGAYGLAPGNVLQDWVTETSASEDLSSLISAEYEEPTTSSESSDSYNVWGNMKPALSIHDFVGQKTASMESRKVVEALRGRQYWTSDRYPVPFGPSHFDIGKPSTLGRHSIKLVDARPCHIKHLASLSTEGMLSCCHIHITEEDAVREVLMLLQGHASYIFGSGSESTGNKIQVGFPSVTVIRLIPHFSSASQTSILGFFATCANTLNPLRRLVVENVVPTASGTPRCATFEAFTAGVGDQLIKLDRWCAAKEEQIVLAQQGDGSSSCVVSLLNLKQQVEVIMAGTFDDLLKVAQTVEAKRGHLSPSLLSTFTVNSVWTRIRARLAIDDKTSAIALFDVWRICMEPVWTNLMHWLNDGIPIHVDFDDDGHKPKPTWDGREFFVRTNPLIEPGIPEFWEGGYTLPPCHRTSSNVLQLHGDSEDDSPLPHLLAPVSKDILAAGKAIGLLRAIDVLCRVGKDWLSRWDTFSELTKSLRIEEVDRALDDLVLETVLGPCRLAQGWLRRVLVEECQLWKHVRGLEEVCLMTRGDAMSQFSDRLFVRMDSRHPWTDFHFLNTAFQNVSRAGSRSWINPSLVRFSYRGRKDRNINRTVRAIDGLIVEYAVPFPLIYLFGPESHAGYSSVFRFLLQIRRAKNVLDRILIRGLGDVNLNYNRSDLRLFNVLRGKLTWFVNTLLNFIATNVIHTGTLYFHELLRDVESLDEMISVHRMHLDRILSRCLLQANTAALYRSILSILDLCLNFSDTLSAFTTDSSLDISRHSLILMTRRHRRRRALKPDIIAFTEQLPPSDMSDSTDTEDSEESVGEVAGTFENCSISNSEDSFMSRLSHISQELDGLVRFVRRGIESLAAGTGDASTTFGILAFDLESWDL
ncbi:Spc98 family-domain-containing protein [Hysterangium stoloniferum]|nr:Spc98 family-domain-containing protein [Hysterangium stoloniferum]